MKRPLFTDAKLPDEVRAHLARYYGEAHTDAILERLSEPPSQTTIRVNTFAIERQELARVLNKQLAESADGGRFVSRPHPTVPDALAIDVSGPHDIAELERKVLIDIGCAEAVLRGADIFAPGLVTMSMDIAAGNAVSVYVQQFGCQLTKGIKLKPGLLRASGARHVGNGTAVLSREAVFGGAQTTRGLGIRMDDRIFASPSLHDVLADRMFLQNLPSMVASHALAPIPPGARVLDMCAAPGGKTTHLAALQPGATVLALDRSARRLALVAELAAKLGASNVSTQCMSATAAPSVLGHAQFERILLDPPCSALGLRPRLNWRVSVDDLARAAKLQRQLIKAAHLLLAEGGVLVYSTCTINPAENEETVAYALRECPDLALERPSIVLGEPGVANAGLDEAERALVQRFDPSTEAGRTSIGFFVARFVKRGSGAVAAAPAAASVV
jgi:16S rRNA C967 or C1407 C5-methylase (RsmB/RsmF family)